MRFNLSRGGISVITAPIVVTYGAINLSNAMTIASEALRHYPRNHTSLTQNYTIINYRSQNRLKRG
ncbi:hypothetical protein RhiirA5_440801 [Rhizophagus irregularis]|uniref:Uncharacterized protein n=2 Tax=Rhizophagus irregularis TaxID=588596 RepID=A0A2N0NGB6_9GLOM|nr:hypothetical protein RhiirA5_440801 [Rhizophagus irregularis]GBC27402.2 hypothetical protein GLOIN_2v1762238 [Rhizophagus irregularis DAOM 181602=DAOM 197198]